MNYSMPGLPVHHQLSEFTQTHLHWVSDAIQPSHPLSSPFPPAFNLSQHQGLFQWVSSSPQWPKYWSFSFSISPSNEYSGLTSFSMDCLISLLIQGKNFLFYSGKPWEVFDEPLWLLERNNLEGKESRVLVEMIFKSSKKKVVVTLEWEEHRRW